MSPPNGRIDTRAALAPGVVIDGLYEITRLVAGGGFGITYGARDIALDVEVALKEYFPAEFAARSHSLAVTPRAPSQQPLFEHCRLGFLREARTLAQFRHPAIVRVLRVFEANGTAYMAMEFEHGHSLTAWLEALGRAPTQDEIDRIIDPLLSAMQAIHAASFLHRDIASDNVIIRDNGSPVLLDFGAARQILAEASQKLTGIVKRGYSPPEQYGHIARLQGPWTDIYALGAILYRMISGELPPPAPDRQLGIAMRPAAQAAKGDYRPAFLAAIDAALALAPAQRPQSLAEFDRLLRGAPPAAIATQRLQPATASATALAAGPEVVQAIAAATAAAPAAATPSGPFGRGGLAIAAMAAGTLATIGIAAWLAVTTLSGPRSTPAPQATRSAPLPSTLPDEAARPAAEAARAAAQLAAAERQERDRRAAEEQARLRAAEEDARQRAAAARQAELDRQAEADRRRNAEQAAQRQLAVIADLRRELNRVGCETTATAPAWSEPDRLALARFIEASKAAITSAQPERATVAIVERYRNRVCPLQCAAGEIAINGRCEAARSDALQPTPPASQPVPPVPQATRTAPAAPRANTVQCNDINERAQLGLLTEDDRELLRTLRCR